MTRTIPALHLVVLVTAILTAAGCQGSSKEKESKRESDRMMMRMQEADRERNDMKAQIDQLKANLDTAVKRSRDAQTELTAAQARLKQAQDELAKSQSNAAAAADLQGKLTVLQANNETLIAQTKSLQQQLAAAKAEAAKMMPAPVTTTPPSTQPSLKK
ncbi:MAG: hypothetical protein H7Z14_09700 [Anaerolineae bacterium]|nr:hypothetical protein [Phycisphaerae bacterium]